MVSPTSRELVSHLWSGALLDVRHALRSLGQTPGVTATIVVMLALGIGANAAIYGVLEKLFFRPTPHVSDPDNIVRLYRTGWDTAGSVSGTFSYSQYSAFRELPAFTDVASSVLRHYYVGYGPQAELVSVSIVTGSFFRFLGARPFLGRFLDQEDDRVGATAAAVISHAYWRRWFGGNQSAGGSTLALSEVTYTIVGVAPPGFSGPDWDAPDVCVPIHIAGPVALGPSWLETFWLGMLARLSPTATAALAAEQATSVLRTQLADEPGREMMRERVTTGPIMEARGPDADQGVLRLPVVVGGVAAGLLIVSSVNVTVVLLLRAARRRRELAVRSVLGAGRWRTTRLMVLESLALALGAALAATALGTVTTRVLRVILLPSMNWAAPAFDTRLFLFAAGAALAIGLLTGSLPAILARRSAVMEDLRAGTQVADRRQAPIRATLLMLQGVLAMVLMVGAGVFYRSLEAARRRDVGFDVDRLLVVQLYRFRDRRAVGVEEEAVAALVDRARRLPGIVDISQSTVSAGWWSSVLTQRIVPGGLQSMSRGEPPSVAGVTANFFEVNGLAITRGRGFTDADGVGAPKVAVVSRTLAIRLWPGADPLGACLRVGQPNPNAECIRVVGVVEDAGGEAMVPSEQFPRSYVPLPQSAQRAGPRSLVIRTREDPRRLTADVLRAMGQVFPDLPRERVQALPDLLASRVRPWTIGAGLFGAAAALALLVAAIGLYAAIAFAVRMREQEFGVRRAVGATTGHLVRLVMTQSVGYAVGGILLGSVVGQLGARFIDPLLYRETSARDPTAYVVAGIMLLAACLAAATFPARAAARVGPRVSLQAE